MSTFLKEVQGQYFFPNQAAQNNTHHYVSHSPWCICFRQNTLEPLEHEVSSKITVKH